MKQIIGNRYLKEFKFSSSHEALIFFNNIKAKSCLFLEDTYGENYYCYVSYHSLTKEKQFILLFCSDESEENLNFIFWDNLLVLDTGKSIFLIDEYLNIKSSLLITTPLVGLYLINKEKLLILEEAFMRVVDCQGQIVKSELFDLIEDFNISDNSLSIQTSKENRVIILT